MGNKESSPAPTNPWATVAKATQDERGKLDKKGLGDDAEALQVRTAAIVLPANIVPSSLRAVDGTLAFELIATEETVVDLFADDSLLETARQTFPKGSSGFSAQIPSAVMAKPEVRFLVVARASKPDASNRVLKLTLLFKNNRLLILRKQAEINGRTVDLEEIYGIGSAKECVICISEISDTTFIPCRHMCACAECAAMLMATSPIERKCPVCRSLITTTVKVST